MMSGMSEKATRPARCVIPSCTNTAAPGSVMCAECKRELTGAVDVHHGPEAPRSARRADAGPCVGKSRQPHARASSPAPRKLRHPIIGMSLEAQAHMLESGPVAVPKRSSPAPAATLSHPSSHPSPGKHQIVRRRE